MARLLLSTPDGQQVVELGVHNALGRHPTNSIQLLDKIVSKEHCVIERRAGQLILRDLGSLNGTYVNGERVVGERPLRHGDDIALGSTRARVDDAPVSGPTSPHGPHTHPQMAGTQPVPSVGRPSQAMPQMSAPVSPPTQQSSGTPPRVGGFPPVTA